MFEITVTNNRANVGTMIEWSYDNKLSYLQAIRNFKSMPNREYIFTFKEEADAVFFALRWV